MSRRGLTLVETLVVMSVVGLLLSLAAPVVQRVRGAADRAGCLNHLRQMGTACHLFHNDYGRFPPVLPRTPTDPRPNHHHSRFVPLLPYLDHRSLYEQSVRACALDGNPMNNPPHVAFAQPIRIFTCPTDPRLLRPQTDWLGVTAAFTSYVAIAGVSASSTRPGMQGAFGGVPGCKYTDIHDGGSNTIMVGERPPPANLQAGWWYPGFYIKGEGNRGPNTFMPLPPLTMHYEPCVVRTVFGPGRLDNPCDRLHLWSLHGGGANFLFADGSARWLDYSAEPLIPALATINGGEPVIVPD